MKTKKLLALLLCAMMVSALFACAQPAAPATEAPAAEATEAPAAEATEAAPAEKIEITYAMWGNEEEAANTQKTADVFNASQDRIHVSVIPIPWETYVEKLNTMAAAGQLPDCAIMQEPGVIQWAQQGLLYDIGDMYAGSDSKPLDNLAFKYDGKTVAYSVAFESLLMYYNKDMFDKAGIPYPSADKDKAYSWDEFVATAKLLTLDANGKNANDPAFDKDNIVQYGCMVENLAWQLEVWCLSNGSGYYSKDGKSVIINDPAAMEAIQKIADLYLVDHVAPLSTGMTDDGVSRSLIAGTVAMTTNGAWNIGTCLSAARDAGLNYGVAVLPYMKDKVTINTGGPNVVFSQSKNPEAAMEFIKWYTSPENSWDALIATGIWMPTLSGYYTDETLTHKWLDNPAYPPYEEAKSVLVDYAMEYSVPASWYYVNNTVDFNNLLSSILGDVWNGNKTAEEVITANYDALVAAFNGQ